jgi:hypothetical protein
LDNDKVQEKRRFTRESYTIVRAIESCIQREMPRTNTKTRTGSSSYEKTSPTWKEYGRRWEGITQEKVWNATHR